MPPDWRQRLITIGRMFGKLPDEVASRPWSTLNQWLDWAEETL